jgi:hypothetical protein
MDLPSDKVAKKEKAGMINARNAVQLLSDLVLKRRVLRNILLSMSISRSNLSFEMFQSCNSSATPHVCILTVLNMKCLCLNQLGRWGQNLSGFFYSHRALIMGKI